MIRSGQRGGQQLREFGAFRLEREGGTAGGRRRVTGARLEAGGWRKKTGKKGHSWRLVLGLDVNGGGGMEVWEGTAGGRRRV